MAYDVRFEDISTPRPLAVVRRCVRVQELSRFAPEACGKVWNVVRAQ